MSENPLPSAPTAVIREELEWMPGACVEACPACKRVFLVPGARSNQPCPICYQAALLPQPSLVPLKPPEIVIPIQLSDQDLSSSLASFIEKVPYREGDLTVENLVERAQVLWWPLWLVDADLEGEWSGTVGFDYQVRTAVESYDGDGWHSSDTQRTQTRYEPRQGTLKRHYDNIPIPALLFHEKRLEQIGKYQSNSAQGYRFGMLGQTTLQLPEIEPQALQEVAQTRLHSAAEREITQATGAQHRQQIRFSGECLNLNWTKYLLPLISSWYRDQDGNLHPIVVNGQSGRVYGRRYASMRQATKWTLGLMAVPVLVMLIALLIFLMEPASMPVSLTCGGGIVFILALLALLPLLRARTWNNRQQSMEEFR